MPTETEGSILGNAVLRREDPTLLTGADTYLDDMSVDGMTFIHFVRSPLAHGTILEIDTSAAEEMPGVVGVYSASNPDFGSMAYNFGNPAFGRPLFAADRVRLVGDIVAKEEHGGGAHGGTHGVERLALVGWDEQQLADLLAVTDVELPDREVDPLDLGDDGLALVIVECAVVNGDRGRFLLERELGMVGDESAKGVKELRSAFLKCRVEVEREIDVELAPVGADEVDLGREAAERSEVPQRSAGDHGDVGLG